MMLVRLQVRIDLRGDDRGVTQQLLDGEEIDTGHRQPAGKRVAQIVPREVLDLRLTRQRAPCPHR